MNTRYVRPPLLEEPYGLRHDLLDKLKGYLNSTNIIAQSVPNIDLSSDTSIKREVILLSKLNAEITWRELNDAIDALEKCDCSKRLTDDDIALFKAVFDDHFKRTHGYPISYTESPHIAINDILCKIAKDIDRMTDRQIPWLKLLISSLDDEDARRYSTDTFRLKNAVLSQDNKKILPVEMVKDEKVFETLTPVDKEALLSHSPQARAFHLSRSQSGEFPRVSRRQPGNGVSASAPVAITGSLLDLDLALLDSGAPVKVDTASVVGLKACLEPYLRSIFLTQKELCDFMITHLSDRKDWQILVDILGDAVLDKLFPQPSTSWFGFFNSAPALAAIADDQHLAMWFCANAAYQKRRATGSNYVGFEMGQDASKSKECKVAGASFIMSAILSGQGFEGIYAKLERKHELVKKSLTTGSLGQINRTFLSCAKEQYNLSAAARSFGH